MKDQARMVIIGASIKQRSIYPAGLAENIRIFASYASRTELCT